MVESATYTLRHLSRPGMWVYRRSMHDLVSSARFTTQAYESPSELVSALSERSTVLVTGGTGFVGIRLVDALIDAGHNAIVLSRKPGRAAVPGKAWTVGDLDSIPGDTRIDAIVNLAGEPIANGLWTAAKRQKIIASRLGMIDACLKLVQRLVMRPQVFITASAIGWYGIRGDEALDEGSDGADCFSREVCVAIEQAAQRVEKTGLRTICLRIGLVLDRAGGMLGRMLTPFRLGLGGPFGKGQHWMSWVHRDDLIRLIAHCIATPDINGPVNGTAPEPVRNSDFTRSLGKALRRPAFIPVPALPLKLALGQFAEELLLGGQRVLPVKAAQSGFVFRHPELDGALMEILAKR